MKRREFCFASAATAVIGATCPSAKALATRVEPFPFKYILGSSMYGYESLETVLSQVHETGASAIDIWPKVHGNQREQIDEMGEQQFRDLLDKHDVKLGCLTQYKLGPFGLKEEMGFASRFGCQTIVTGAKGPTGLKGEDLRSAVGEFIEQMKPHLETAAENDVTIAIENHANSLIDSPDSIRHLFDLRTNDHLAIALAPYHLPQDESLLAKLIRDCGNGIAMFYAWQHGNGCMQAQEKELELLQMPGRGSLDFAPLVEALHDIKYTGWTEIFMHPFPRGIPILERATEVTAEINRSRQYLANCFSGN